MNANESPLKSARPFNPHFRCPSLPPSAYDQDDGTSPLAAYDLSWPLQRLLSVLTHAYATNTDLRNFIDARYFPNGAPLHPRVSHKFSALIRTYLQQYPTNSTPSMSMSELATAAKTFIDSTSPAPTHAPSQSNL